MSRLTLTTSILVFWSLFLFVQLPGRGKEELSALAAEEKARDLLEKVTAGQLEERLVQDRRLAPSVLRTLAMALTTAEPALRTQLQRYVAACARANYRRLSSRGAPWAAEEIALLLSLQLLDPERFIEEPAFRQTILEILPDTLAPEALPELRDRLLYELNRVDGVDFVASERIEWAWGAIPRRSLEREVPYRPKGLIFTHKRQGRIVASVYSLSSHFFTAAEASGFLAAVRRLAPQRTLVVLTDLPLREELEEQAGRLNIHLIETYGRDYTPWPRDPLSLVRSRAGGVLVLLRPNTQPKRAEDAFLGLELIQNLPPHLDRAWGGVRWTTAAVPFHNGQNLFAQGEAWISIHTLELRILQLLGLDRVPVASFRTVAGVQRYVAAARQAAAELESLYRRRIHFVHPLPGTEPLATQQALMDRLGGGAGFDLDSLLALVPEADGRPLHALIADIGVGLTLLERLSPGELKGLQQGYRLKGEAGSLARALVNAQKSLRAIRLSAFLGLLADHLRAEGLIVHRLPLLLVPTTLLEDFEGAEHQDFLISWNNVVIEAGPAGVRAEGFSGLLEQGDEEARRVFAEAGCELELLPTLVASVVLNGGYRCASNHLRAAPGD